MGTRSTTKFYKNNVCLLALYKQYDGYPTGWGVELKTFIEMGAFCNGINPEKAKEKQFLFNGFEDFVLQVVKQFKEGSGGLYATTPEDEQEYNYIVKWEEDEKSNKAIYKLSIECLEEPGFNKVYTGDIR